MSQRISFKVRGEVQGVFYRKFTQEKAQGYAVTGFVRNMADGSVTGEAQGTPDALDHLLRDMRQGPRHALVSGIEKETTDVKEGESGFDIK